jgi:uncharacterized protein involved in exopolysaccharide biosynthesis
MGTSVVQTPRDRLQRLLDYGIRARRYWWIAAAFVVIGAALSVGFAMTRPQNYASSAVLFYQERIQTSLLQGRDAAVIQRNIGERYRELLLARSQLAKIVEDPELNAFKAELEDEGLEGAVEQLRLSISFSVRGQNTFHITYMDADPVRAQKVTQRLTELLIDKEAELRLETANATVEFANKQLDAATQDLLAREKARAQFLVAHPEFADDDVGGTGGEGAAVRRQQEQPRASSGPSNPRLNALERQRGRIRARLAAANGTTTTPVVERTPSASEQQARRKVDIAEDEVRSYTRELDALRTRGLTDNHPDVRKVKDQLAEAQQRQKRAEAELAAIQADIREPIAAPRNENERAALERELREVEQQISSERSRASNSATPTPTKTKNDIAEQVVQLETEWARLRREVAEQAERVQTLNDSVFRAQLDAQTKIAEAGASLQVVDPAFLPKKPQGKGKKMLVMAGLVVFTGLGFALAIGLAIVDDRIYRRVDVESLGVAPVLAVIPREKRRRRAKRDTRPETES